MRTRIWNEMTKTKHDVEFIREYSRFQNIIQKSLTILILVFSSTGILGWKLWESPALSGIACAITAGISLTKMISPYIILSNQDFRRLDVYYLKLSNHYDKIEKLWYDSEKDGSDENLISNEFYRLVKNGNKLHHKYSELNIVHIKLLINAADNHSNSYFSNTFIQ